MPAPLPAPTFDAGAAYPEVNDLRKALDAADWPAVRALFADRDHDGRTLLVREAGDHCTTDAFLRRVHDEDPTDQLAGTLLGTHLICAGWRIRSGARAEHVSRSQFDQFHDHLRRAEQVLIDVTARHPDDAAAWTQRITLARGLQLGQNEARRRYDRLAQHHPHHAPAQASLLQQFCPKWSGNWDRAFGFARECADAAPDGSLNAVVVAEAHLERWLDFDTAREQSAYLRSEAVVNEIMRAGQRSVLHPDFVDRPGWVWVRSSFALMFSLTEQWSAAASQFRALGNRGTSLPWAYVDDAEGFTKYRDKAYAKGGQS
ncbi:hypothetical protein O7634_02365 [Micromonospora sp. WMMD1120]|uniref:hypothetical protein n=1 Tax=Micromonospora sp. WMMD1120 TaxID=3016106 RepID=UPI002416138E|nr:hypothetical protein [Micromonospora sp. WMMD1120]MDG4805601.1 hypothetical protein [Micromonospora sp. WMMD1120]